MQGLSPNVDLQSIVGAKISQICFSRFQSIFSFDVDARIAVESTCEYTDRSGRTVKVVDYPAAASSLCELLDAVVQSCAREVDGGLTLHFDTQAQLRLLNDNKEYESFQVHIGREVFVA